MRQIVAAFGFLLLVAGLAPVRAAVLVSTLEVLPAGVPGEQVMITPDYFVAEGAWSAYGFLEYSGEAGGWFTNHSATYSVAKYVGLRGEVGLDDADTSSAALGITFSLPIPGFVYLKASPQRVFGVPERTREVNLAWKSKNMPAFGGSVWTEGFIRFLRDAGNTYGQPQVWYRRGDSTWAFGLEAEVAGSERTMRGGVRKTF